MDSLLTHSLSPEFQTRHRETPFRPSKSPQMTAESDERLVSRLGTRPVEQEHLPCPRCDSTNTKFCYYNNYNLSQPRHFCKSCRRYWTRGGALRNVPVGGSTRKAHSSNKRPRIATAIPTSAAPSSSNSLVSCSNENDVSGQIQAMDPVVSNPAGLGSVSVAAAAVNLNETAARPESGNLSSWWGIQMGIGDGILPLNGYGLGLGPGLGYGLGVLDWPMEQMGGANGGAVIESPGGNTWQMGGGSSGEGGVAEGEYFTWPELAISTPAKALK